MEKPSTKKPTPKREILYFPHVQAMKNDYGNRDNSIWVMQQLANGNPCVL